MGLAALLAPCGGAWWSSQFCLPWLLARCLRILRSDANS